MKTSSPQEMCITNTPVENYLKEFGLHVKREDTCCPGGPNFSKTRGVFAHVKARPENTIGVLDTSHSQGGWAVARACQLLGKHCIVYYPVRKADRIDESILDWDPTGRGLWGDVLKPQQVAAADLGASLIPLAAGRSAVLYHAAKSDLRNELGEGKGYMMPNALKLTETVTETAREFGRTKLPDVPVIVVSASSATIAAGVVQGALQQGWSGRIIVHMGYSRPAEAVRKYIDKMVDGGVGLFSTIDIQIIDEGYEYADNVRMTPTVPFPCNEFYDLKALCWWVSQGRQQYKKALLWNIG